MLQRIVLRAFPNNLLVRKDICPFLVLRVSLRCLIYKVHTANSRREFHSTTPGSLCQHLFSNFFEALCRVTFVIPALSLAALSLSGTLAPALTKPLAQALGYLTTSYPLCQHLFSLFSKFFVKTLFCPQHTYKCPQKYRLRRRQNCDTLELRYILCTRPAYNQ